MGKKANLALFLQAFPEGSFGQMVFNVPAGPSPGSSLPHTLLSQEEGLAYSLPTIGT